MGYICVVGGANVDIFLSPYKKLKLRDSNPGQLRISCGGVGRNIAENLARHTRPHTHRKTEILYNFTKKAVQ